MSQLHPAQPIGYQACCLQPAHTTTAQGAKLVSASGKATQSGTVLGNLSCVGLLMMCSRQSPHSSPAGLRAAQPDKSNPLPVDLLAALCTGPRSDITTPAFAPTAVFSRGAICSFRPDRVVSILEPNCSTAPKTARQANEGRHSSSSFQEAFNNEDLVFLVLRRTWARFAADRLVPAAEHSALHSNALCICQKEASSK